MRSLRSLLRPLDAASARVIQEFRTQNSLDVVEWMTMWLVEEQHPQMRLSSSRTGI
jgi:hypothetical protein